MLDKVRTKKAIKEVVKGNTSLSGAFRKAGYSEASVRSGKIARTKKFKEEAFDVLKELEKERTAIIKRLKSVRSRAKYRDLIDGLDKITKNMQLLSGKDTEKVGFSLSKLLKEADEKTKS